MTELAFQRSKAALILIPQILFFYALCQLLQPLILALSPPSPVLSFLVLLALSSLSIFLLKLAISPLLHWLRARPRMSAHIAEEAPHDSTPTPLQKAITLLGDHSILRVLHVSPQISTFAARKDDTLKVRNLKVPSS
ncbi:MAG: hypothetical protein P1V97_25515, partial [Planctomycetota bacterium]|nr:hypothetical protein [Planctomycetota bacterium]